MVLQGTIHKEGRYWVVSVPDLEIVTQGLTKKDAYEMIQEAIELHIGGEDFRITIDPISKGEFLVAANDTAALLGLMLKRQRQINGLSVRDVTKRLKKKTNTYYHQYERGKATAGIDKLTELLRAMNPNLRVAIHLLRSG